MKNTLYSDNQLFVDGENLFHSGDYDKALLKFEEFVDQYPNLKKQVIGRIAITLLKLKQFKEAKNKTKEAIKLNPEKEKEYSTILAECYYGLDEYDKVITYCNNYIEKYGYSEDISLILNRILPNPEYDILREKNDLNYLDADCAAAFERITMKFFKIQDYNSAEYYAQLRLQYNDIEAVDSYFILGDIYEQTKQYYKCSNLLAKANTRVVSDYEKGLINDHLLAIYKKSDCFELSEYAEENPKLENVIKIYEKAKEAIKLERLKAVFNNYQPVLDLGKYFNLEPRLQLVVN